VHARFGRPLLHEDACVECLETRQEEHQEEENGQEQQHEKEE
jgi:hypothetical protein